MPKKLITAVPLRDVFRDAYLTQCVMGSRSATVVPRPGAGTRHHFMDLFLLGTTRHPMLGQRSRIRTLGEAKVAIKNGFVVPATDSAGGSRTRQSRPLLR